MLHNIYKEVRTVYIMVTGNNTIQEKRFIGLVEMAKILRKELKTKFPNTKFSVRSSSYSMGCSIDVSYTDGVPYKEVDAIVQKYSGKGFDGMVDYAYSKSLCLLKDGTLDIISSEGSACTGGYNNGFDLKLPEGAVEVDTSHPYVFTSRDISEEITKVIIEKVRVDFDVDADHKEWQHHDKLGNRTLYEYAGQITHKANLETFNGVRDTGVTCGNYDEFVECY